MKNYFCKYQKEFFLLLMSIVLVTTASYLRHTKSNNKSTLLALTVYSPKMISLLTLNNKAIYDNIISIWALQNLNKLEKNHSLGSSIIPALKAIANTHPKVHSFYLSSCYALIFDLKKPLVCETILQPALDLFPKKWQVSFLLTHVFSNYIINLDKARIYAQLAVSRGAPNHVKRLLGKIKRYSGLVL